LSGTEGKLLKVKLFYESSVGEESRQTQCNAQNLEIGYKEDAPII